MKNFDNFINFTYLLSIGLFLIFLFAPLNIESSFLNYSLLFIPLLLFILLPVIFKGFYKKYINNKKVNILCRKLKNVSLIILIFLIITLIGVSILLNKDLHSYSKDGYFYLVNSHVFTFARDIIFKLIFPIFAILFYINFKKNRDISLKYSNLKYFSLTSFLLIVLVQFSMLISMTIYNLILFFFINYV